MGRSVSQAQIRKNRQEDDSAESLLKSRNTLEKVKDQQQKVYFVRKREIELQELKLLDEIESLQRRIAEVEEMNEAVMNEKRELQDLQSQ